MSISTVLGVVERNGRVWVVLGGNGEIDEWREITETAPWNADE